MMVLSKKIIRRFRLNGRMNIDSTLETILLREFGAEPTPNEYTEQDILEQVRLKVAMYNDQKAREGLLY